MMDWNSELTEEEWSRLWVTEQELKKSSTEYLGFVLHVVADQLSDRNKAMHNKRRVEENKGEGE